MTASAPDMYKNYLGKHDWTLRRNFSTLGKWMQNHPLWPLNVMLEVWYIHGCIFFIFSVVVLTSKMTQTPYFVQFQCSALGEPCGSIIVSSGLSRTLRENSWNRFASEKLVRLISTKCYLLTCDYFPDHMWTPQSSRFLQILPTTNQLTISGFRRTSTSSTMVVQFQSTSQWLVHTNIRYGEIQEA